MNRYNYPNMEQQNYDQAAEFNYFQRENSNFYSKISNYWNLYGFQYIKIGRLVFYERKQHWSTN